jgi:hypothetical protein
MLIEIFCVFSSLFGINKATGTGSDVLRTRPGPIVDGPTLHPDIAARRENAIKANNVLRNGKIKSIIVLSPLSAPCSVHREIIKRK